MCVDILWLCIGSEFAVLAVSLSLDGRQMSCSLVRQRLIIHKPHYMVFLPFVTTHFNTAVLTVMTCSSESR